MLDAVASGVFDGMMVAMAETSRNSETFKPATGTLQLWHDKRFDLHERLHAVAGEAAAEL